MWIREVKVENVRSFQSASIQLSKGLNVIVGKNNAGKSTILKGILRTQDENSVKASDLRHGCSNGFLEISIEKHESSNELPQIKSFSIKLPTLNCVAINPKGSSTSYSSGQRFKVANPAEPGNILYPYLSRRKSASYNEQIRILETNSVTGTFSNLYAKLTGFQIPMLSLQTANT